MIEKKNPTNNTVSKFWHICESLVSSMQRRTQAAINGKGGYNMYWNVVTLTNLYAIKFQILLYYAFGQIKLYSLISVCGLINLAFHLARWLERCGHEQAFILSSQSWEIGSPPTGGHTHLTHSYILKKDPPPLCEDCQCNLTVRHILVECNNFAQERKDIFGRRDVVESFRFHPTLIVLFLKQTEFYYKF